MRATILGTLSMCLLETSTSNGLCLENQIKYYLMKNFSIQSKCDEKDLNIASANL